LYPGTPGTTIVREKSMADGDSANTSILSLSSHAGTHVDVPRHFCREGGSVRDVFQRLNTYAPAYCIDPAVTGDACIRPEDLEGVLTGREDSEALLIRTGAWQLRTTDPRAYAAEHPWVQAGVAALLRRKCPRLRLLGIDTISISTPSHRQEGQESHRAFLCDKDPIYLLEDADLSSVHPKDRFALTVIPWLLEYLDGVPVTAFLMNNCP
jgi:kynurenine formamidase